MSSSLLGLDIQLSMSHSHLQVQNERARITSRDSCYIQNLCKEGRLGRALVALLRMESVPTVQAYESLLWACIKRRALAEANQVHAHLARHGLESNQVLGDLVVTTLVSCGSLVDGLQLFERLPRRTVYSWTAMISGYTNAGRCQDALSCYKKMQEDGVQPDKYAFVSLLKACSKLVNLDEGKRIHAHALGSGLQSDIFVSNTLISMYGKCGSIKDAEQVFGGLCHRNLASWNAMLGAYCQQGQGGAGLEIYKQMQEAGVMPNDRTFVSALRACATLAEEENRAIEQGQNVGREAPRLGREIHADAASRGFDSDMFVGNALINMYSKCGKIMSAEQVFSSLSRRDLVSWNSMLSAYAKHGQEEKCLWTYRKMQEDGIRPDARTFISSLQACAAVAEKEHHAVLQGQNVKMDALQRAKKIHFDAATMGYDTDIFLRTALICAYAKCGSMKDAELVFDGLSKRDVVTWNVMLAACLEQDEGEKVLQGFWQMQEEGVRPNVRIFVSALQACVILAEREESAGVHGENVKVELLQTGKEIHVAAAGRGLQADVFVGSTLITVYAKCGSIKDAQVVFDRLLEPNLVSWNAMLAAYAHHGGGQQVLETYRQMLEERVDPDARSFVSAIQACATLAERERSVCLGEQNVKVNALQRGKEVHAGAAPRGFDSHMFVANTLVSMYAKCGSIQDAEQVFCTMSHHDLVSWNVMLAAYSQMEQGDDAFYLYQLMQEEGVGLDAWTLSSALQACATLADREETKLDQHGQHLKVESLQKVREVHADAASVGLDSDLFVGSALICAYQRCGPRCIKDSENIFGGLSQQDVVSWNAMLEAYAQGDQGEKALQMYGQMQAEGIRSDLVTFMSVLKACSTVGALETCVQLHQSIVESGLETSLRLSTSLIHAYSKCACLEAAQSVFDSLPQPDVVSWTALLAGYACIGDCERSLMCYEEMCYAGLKPDGVTFLALLCACSHAGIVEQGLHYFESMSKDHGIAPELEHYVCMIDLLGRSGHVKQAEELSRRMPMDPNLSVWLCLLGICQKHGDVVLGKLAFEGAVTMEPNNPVIYVLMSNIYCHAGLWDCAEGINELRQRAGAWKKPGESWIEYEQEMHTFLVGEDCRHQQAVLIYKSLKELSSHMTAPK